MRYVDENGEWAQIVIGAAIGGIANVITNWSSIKGNDFWVGFGYFAVGAAVGALSSVSGVWIAGVTQTAGVFAGALVGAATGAVTGAATSSLTTMGRRAGLE